MNLESQKYIQKLREQGFTNEEIAEYMSLKALQKEHQDEKEQELQKGDWIDGVSSILSLTGAGLTWYTLLLDNELLKVLGFNMGVTCVISGILISVIRNGKLLKCHHESPYDHQITYIEKSKSMKEENSGKTR